MIDFNTYSQGSRAWERGRSPVSRGVLSPTLTQITNKLYGSIINIYWFYDAYNLCQFRSGRGHPDLRFFVMPIALNGALENGILQKHYNLTYFSRKLFFNVKILKKL